MLLLSLSLSTVLLHCQLCLFMILYIAYFIHIYVDCDVISIACRSSCLPVSMLWTIPFKPEVGQKWRNTLGRTYVCVTVKPFDAHCCHMSTAVEHPVPDQVKLLFVFFDIRALWRSGLSKRPSARVSKIKWRLNLVWHRMLYSCTYTATVGVKGLICPTVQSRSWTLIDKWSLRWR